MYSPPEKHSPETLLKILHSITRLEMDHGELNVFFGEEKDPEVPNGFLPTSFTRRLLDLIEEHLS